MRHLLALIVLLSLTGCGTAVFNHTVSVAIEDPSHRLGDPPFEVSVFDKHQGYSAEWARKTMGESAPGRPYVGHFSSVDTVMVGNSGPRPNLELSFAIPKLDPDGYFVTSLAVGNDGETRSSSATFTRWGDYFPAQVTWSVPLKYRASQGPDGWKVDLIVIVPALK